MFLPFSESISILRQRYVTGGGISIRSPGLHLHCRLVLSLKDRAFREISIHLRANKAEAISSFNKLYQ
jgi:hypothetical protein